MEKIPISMIKGGSTNGAVTSNGHTLEVTPILGDIATEFGGGYDNASGVMFLTFPGYPKLEIRGFLTLLDVKEGKMGRSGRDGRAGLDGVHGDDGEEGSRGCEGPEGPQGKPGITGSRGIRGIEGPEGKEGPQGPEGKPGVIEVYVQAEEPEFAGPGAFWVRP